MHLRAFYKGRSYQFAWFTEDGIAEHTRSFWNLHNNYIRYFGDTALKYKELHRQMDLLMNQDSTVDMQSERILQTELQLTKHFFEYSTNAYLGKLNPKNLEWYIPRKKINVLVLLDSLVAGDGKNLQDWEPVNSYYQYLKSELVHLYNIDKAGGWKEIAFDQLKNYKPGDSAFIIKQLKQRLRISSFDQSVDTTEYYTTGLVSLIKTTQKSFGIQSNGIVNDALIKELNVSVKDRIRQVLINLERMRWVPDQPGGNLIIEANRAFSHGCIRLSEPEKLASYLLRNQPEWTPKRMNEAMSASAEKWITLKEQLPVLISYFTSWVDSEGLLNFRDDIYGQDKEMAKHLLDQ